MIKVCVLDYGSGNVASVHNFIKFLNFDCVISNKSKVIENSTHIVLPGVGVFGASMEKIKKTIPIKVLENEVLKKNKPFLGICVGMQVLTESSEEFGHHEGLGWIKGKVQKLKSKMLPHIGWNEIIVNKDSKTFTGLKEHSDFYFVNSFCCNLNDKNLVMAETEYDEVFCSVFQKENIVGV
tara:strand:- start:2202 stop:2744 length:543 start_codon:yes stop_codon:yes gene_type:complete